MTIAAFRYNNPYDVSLPMAGWNGGGDIVGIQGQNGFGSFPDMATGYKAGAHRLNTYITGQSSHGPKRTIAELNSVYATDPNWGAGVAQHSGLGLNDTLDPNNADQMAKLRYGVLAQEIGPQNARELHAKYEGGSAVDAVNAAAGAKPQQPAGALAFTGETDDGEDTPALAPAKGALSDANADANNTLYKGESPNKLHGIGAMLTNIASSLASINNPAQAQALRQQAQGIEAKLGGDYQYMMGANGQLVRINKKDGTVDSREIPGSAKSGNWMPLMGKDRLGNPVPIGKFNRDDGTQVLFNKTEAAQGPQVGGDPELTGQERMDSMSEADRRGVQAILEGRDPRVLSSMSLKNNPELRAKLEAALAVEPGLDLNQIKGRANYWTDRSKASPSSWGGIIRRSGIGLDQLEKTVDNMGRLKNTESALGPTVTDLENRAVFGKASTHRQAIITELQTNAQNAATDINSLQQGQHGTGAERESIKGGLFMPNAAPEMQAAAAQAHIDAMKSVVQRAKDAEERTLGKGFIEKDPAFKEYQAIIDRTQAKLDKLKKGDFSYVQDGEAPAAKPAIKSGPQAQNAPKFKTYNTLEEAQKDGWK